MYFYIYLVIISLLCTLKYSYTSSLLDLEIYLLSESAQSWRQLGNLLNAQTVQPFIRKDKTRYSTFS